MDGSANIAHEQRNGGGATRLKEHLAQHGKDAKDCPSVPHEVKTFFNRELDRIRGKRMERERSKLRADVYELLFYVCVNVMKLFDIYHVQ